MKLKLTIQKKINKGLTIEQLQNVLYFSMLKLLELATRNAPVDKGLLRNSMFMKPQTRGYSFYEVGDGVNYGVDVEYGTSPHVIKPLNKKALKFKSGGKTIFAKQINHPGTSAQPFMRPALDQVKNIWLARYFEREF